MVEAGEREHRVCVCASDVHVSLFVFVCVCSAAAMCLVKVSSSTGSVPVMAHQHTLLSGCLPGRAAHPMTSSNEN